MPNVRPTGNSDLLSICALLRWFDHDLLSDLAAHGEDEIVELLASERVEIVADRPGAYRLRTNARAEALARLRAEHPHDELTWHRRFFDHFLHNMQETAPEQPSTQAEESVLYHLGELFLLIAARQEWQILLEHVEAARAASPRAARTYHWLNFYEGFVCIRTQDYDRGKSILTTLRSSPEIESNLRMQVLNALGQAYWFQGQYDPALAMYQQALEIAQQIDDLFYQGIALANMGWIYEGIGKYEQALAVVTQSLAIFRELHDEYREAQALYDIGIYAMRIGRWQVAQNHFRDAIQLYERLNIQPRLARLHWGQGFLHHMLGNELESESAYNRADAISKANQQAEPTLALDIHFQQGFLYQTQGRWEEALDAYERARTYAIDLSDQYSTALIQHRRGNVFERQGRLGEALAAYRAAIDGIEAMRGDAKAEEIKIGLLGTAQQVYESTIVLLLKLDRLVDAFEYVERARSRAFLDLLADKSPELFAAIDQPVATLTEVQRRLPADALLVEYFTVGVVPRGESLINMLPAENTRLREHLTLSPQMLIFAVTSDELKIFQPQIDPNMLRPAPGDPGPGKRMLRERLLTRLHAELIEPLGELLAGRRLLYLIPHGPLHYVPFMALRSAGGTHLLGADGPAVALAPSATVLLRNCLRASPPHPTLEREPSEPIIPLLALGFNDDGDDPLRYAEAEARHVAAMLGGKAWAGPSNKSECLFAEAGRARWLHIAGHAFYDPHDPLGSALKLGAEDTLSARAIIEKLDLNAELVTLSACLSGVTHVVPGDEMLGLQRAFLYAGAPAVVCTLWEAADMVALLVMDRFYNSLRRGLAPASALRDAQVAVRDMTGRDLLSTIARWQAEDPEFAAALGQPPTIPPEALDMQIYADPVHWAPFMLIGRGD